MKWLIVKILSRIIYNQSIINRKVTKMASVIEKLQEFAASITDGLNNIEADLLLLKDLVANGGTPEDVIAALQPILDRINVMKEIQPD